MCINQMVLGGNASPGVIIGLFLHVTFDALQISDVMCPNSISFQGDEKLVPEISFFFVVGISVNLIAF